MGMAQPVAIFHDIDEYDRVIEAAKPVDSWCRRQESNPYPRISQLVMEHDFGIAPRPPSWHLGDGGVFEPPGALWGGPKAR